MPDDTKTDDAGADLVMGTDHSAWRKLEPLRALSDKAFTRLIEASYVHRLPAGTTLATQGTVPDSAHLVLTGAIEVVAEYATRETVVGIRHAPASICFIAAAEALEALCSIRVCEDARIVFLPAKALRAAFLGDADFARALFRLAASVGRDYIMELKNQKLRTGPERLAAWLLRHRNGKARQFTFNLPYDKRRLASRLGMTPENLSRTFFVLRKHGVKLQQTRITVTDSASLLHFANLDETIDRHRI